MRERASAGRSLGLETLGGRTLWATRARRFAWPREAIPAAATALGRLFPADSAIDGLVRINQLGASIWEVSHDWLRLWCLAVGYFALAVISALVFKRGQQDDQR